MGQGAALTVATALRALADPLRLRALSLIATSPTGEARVCDVAELADVSQPTVSHHLKVLRDAGLVTSERRGTWVYYRVAPGYTGAVRSLLEAFAPAALDRGLSAPTPRSGLPGPGGAEDLDRLLSHIADGLAARFPTLDREQVDRVVRESSTGLARSAGVRAHLGVLAERFARQRLEDLVRVQGAGVPADATAAVPRPQVLFVCVANAGRSQLAAALVQHYAGDAVVVRSAGSAPAADVHPQVRGALEALGADGVFPKPLTDDAVRAADVVVTLGCGDVCPVYPGIRYEDWAVGDPALASPEGVAAIRDDLDRRVRALLGQLVPGLAL